MVSICLSTSFSTLSVFFLSVYIMLTRSFFSLLSIIARVMSKLLVFPRDAKSFPAWVMPSGSDRPCSFTTFKIAAKSSGEIS